MSNTKSSSGGISFMGVLFIVFLVLKLCDIIKWSWWWVSCPLWGPATLFIIGFAIYLPFKLRKNKDTRDRLKAGYNEYGWKNGGKSKWQQRLDEMHKQNKKPK